MSHLRAAEICICLGSDTSQERERGRKKERDFQNTVHTPSVGGIPKFCCCCFSLILEPKFRSREGELINQNTRRNRLSEKAFHRTQRQTRTQGLKVPNADDDEGVMVVWWRCPRFWGRLQREGVERNIDRCRKAENHVPTAEALRWRRGAPLWKGPIGGVTLELSVLTSLHRKLKNTWRRLSWCSSRSKILFWDQL